MRKILNKAFFDRKTLIVARELLGKVLVRKYYSPSRKRYVVAKEKITEVEAYIGPHDLASHASKGRTRRTEVMFAEAGTIYVYLVYGMHEMLNVVTENKDYPAAVLIRGTKSAHGPGILTKKFKIDRKLNGLKLGIKSGLWIESNPSNLKLQTYKLPRVGVSYAGHDWSKKKYRFILR